MNQRWLNLVDNLNMVRLWLTKILRILSNELKENLIYQIVFSLGEDGQLKSKETIFLQEPNQVLVQEERGESVKITS